MVVDFKALALALVLNITVITGSGSTFPHLRVQCNNQPICTLLETSVNLTCFYTNITVQTGFWFSPKQKIKWRNQNHPEDLSLDSDYAGRVSNIKINNLSSVVTLTDLRERDAGEYRLLLISEKGEKYISSTGVTLNLTDLRVTRDSTTQTLTCSTSCPLSYNPERYYWYKNGQYMQHQKENTFSLQNVEESMTCSAKGYNEIRAPSVCFGRNCWTITYTDRRICGLVGSSTENFGNYSYPSGHVFKNAFWTFIEPNKDFEDLLKKIRFINRSQSEGTPGRNSILKIKHLRKEDSGEYRLRVITNNDQADGRPGVILTITDLQVRVSHSSVESDEQSAVTLTCSTTCTLSGNPIYIWYNNNQLLTNNPGKSKLYLDCPRDAGNYSCAVKGHDELRSPEQHVQLCDLDYEPESNTILYISVALSTFIVIIIIIGALWIWRRRSRTAIDHNSIECKEKQTSQQDEVYYSRIHFVPSSTENASLSQNGKDTGQEDPVEYSLLNFSRPTADI